MTHRQSSAALQPRHGAVVPLTALLTVFLMIVVAFAVDIGLIVAAQAEAQATADAAALAGAAELGNRLKTASKTTGTILGVQTDADRKAARDRAIAVAKANTIANAPAVLKDNTTEILTGFLLDPTSMADPVSPPNVTVSVLGNTIKGTLPHNAMKVTVFKDASHGGDVRLFFAAVTGRSKAQVTATATAMILLGQPVFGPQGILPFAYPKEEYDTLLKQTKPQKNVQVVYSDGNKKKIDFTDDKAWNPATGEVTNKSDNILEARFYPNPTKNPGKDTEYDGDIVAGAGNYGTINFKLDPYKAPNSTKVLNEIMMEGKIPADNDLVEILKASPTNPKTVNADPGLSQALDQGIEYLIGAPAILPIYHGTNPKSGENFAYNLIGFVPVTITTSEAKGKPHYQARFQLRVIQEGELIPDTSGVPRTIGISIIPVADANQIDPRYIGKLILCQ